jgi:putative ABC transport system permease protein
MAVRLIGDPQQMLPMIRRQVEGSHPTGAMLVNFKTADQILAASVSRERFQAVLLGFFAAIALVLATIGVYGVMSYTTSQRIHEIGIRMALGAKPRDVLWLIVGRGLLLAFIGVAIGGCLSLVVGQVMSHIVYGIESINIVIIASASTCLMVAAAVASLMPARRAMRVDPVVALRHE